ncbi:uncharacterized protein [Typha angustifolia]|uniref:uncharacterized protein n=1 Tax=Typha angustifolia TaxID=59011 RepID=UPI003C2F28B4
MLSQNKRFRGTQMGNHPKNRFAVDSLVVEPFSALLSPTSRSPKSFNNGAVGLGIVAAMSPARSEPIPIAHVSPWAKSKEPKEEDEEKKEDEEDEVEETPLELSESYTCVISRVGENLVRKRVYCFDGIDSSFDENSGVFFESPLERKYFLQR